MGLLDDITSFLDDVRQVGEELDSLKRDVVASVADFGHEASETVVELKQVLTEESADE